MLSPDETTPTSTKKRLEKQNFKYHNLAESKQWLVN